MKTNEYAATTQSGNGLEQRDWFDSEEHIKIGTKGQRRSNDQIEAVHLMSGESDKRQKESDYRVMLSLWGIGDVFYNGYVHVRANKNTHIWACKQKTLLKGFIKLSKIRLYSHSYATYWSKLIHHI